MTAEGEVSQRVSALQFASQAAGVTVAAIGGLGIVGWTLDVAVNQAPPQ